MPMIGTLQERFENQSFCKAQQIVSKEQLAKFFLESGFIASSDEPLTPENFEILYNQAYYIWLNTWCEVPNSPEELTETAMQMKAKKVKFVQLDGMGGYYAEVVDIWLWTDSEGRNWINNELFC